MTSKLREQAGEGRDLIEEAILTLLRHHKDGLLNNDIARELGLESDFNGQQKNYLTYSVLGGLLRRGLVTRVKVGNKQPFRIAA